MADQSGECMRSETLRKSLYVTNSVTIDSFSVTVQD